MTLLLCGQSGLVPCLELALLHGFRSSRLFSKNLYLWDYLSASSTSIGLPVTVALWIVLFLVSVRVRELYAAALAGGGGGGVGGVASVQDYGNPRSDRAARLWLCDWLGRVHAHGAALGKSGKLQLFLCLAAR